ncbi:hypothetical protein P0Y35_03325 [Kiritimatiellaeota bacterium B1221]|nr:hypothetical protein [Kiritimatiellaeota bacterium B1221]
MKMFNTLIIWLLISSLTPLLPAEEAVHTVPLTLEIGDSVDKMKAVLGEPNGKMESGDFSVYYFKYGTVKLTSDKISSLDLISEEEWQRRQRAESEARAERKKQGEKNSGLHGCR